MVKVVFIRGGVIKAAGFHDVSTGMLNVNGTTLSSLDAPFSSNVMSLPSLPVGAGSRDQTSIAARLNG